MKIITALFFTLLSITSFAQQNGIDWVKHIKSSSSNLNIFAQSFVDNEKNNIVAGYFKGTYDFDPGIGTYNLTSNGQFDIFILKLDSLGSFEWAKQIGSSEYEFFRALDVDSDGNIICVGDFRDSLDMNPGGGIDLLYSNSIGHSIFILKLDKNGDYKWARKIEGKYQTFASATEIDLNGNVYTSGNFNDSVDFDPGLSNYILSGLGSQTCYIQKLDSNGNFLWARKFDGDTISARAWITGMKINNRSDLLITGDFTETIDFDPSGNVNSLTSLADYDGFILNMSPNGLLGWVKHFSGTDKVSPYSIDINASDEMIIPFHYRGQTDFDPNAGVKSFAIPPFPRRAVAFVKLNSTGALIWAKNLLNSGASDYVISRFDPSGNIINIGIFTDTLDLDLDSINVVNVVSSPSSSFNSYIQKLDNNGNFISAAQTFGSCIPSANTFVGNKMVFSGYFNGQVNFDSSSTAYTLTSTSNSREGFIAQYSFNSSITSINDIYLESKTYKMFPNPSRGSVNFTFDKEHPKEIVVYDIQGKKVLSKHHINNGKVTFHLPKGIFVVHLQYSKLVAIEKVVIN